MRSLCVVCGGRLLGNLCPNFGVVFRSVVVCSVWSEAWLRWRVSALLQSFSTLSLRSDRQDRSPVSWIIARQR